MFWFTDTDGPTNPQWVGGGAYKRQFTALVFQNNSKCRHTRKPQISKRGVGGGFWPGKATPFPAFLPNVINIWTELYCCGSLITRNVATNSHSMGREHFPFVAQMSWGIVRNADFNWYEQRNFWVSLSPHQQVFSCLNLNLTYLHVLCKGIYPSPQM